ncbi:MAG TPA: NADH:ubiquinone oxidoreductase [bacterium]|nr:NADH:ubiquinone oxidoreductase [bacterium]HEX67488.1 NADH:ubiquinone oxidoreductase [bacterium]
MAKAVVPIGPYHPLQEEPEHFLLTVEGEKVVDVEVHIGYNHRGIEKLAEHKSWQQVTFLVARICGICSTSHPIAYCNAVENLCRVEIPERAKYIRTLVGELERIHSHLLWLGLAGHFLGYNTVWMWVWKWREPILDIFEALTGNRNHYDMLLPGGVRRDLNEEYFPWVRKELGEVKKNLEMLSKAILDDPVIISRLKGIGVLTQEDVKNYGAVGPTARASGVKIDVRKDDPYAAYDLIRWEVATCENGDLLDKVVVRILEIFESIKMVEECMDALEKVKGEIMATIKEVPPGEGIGHHEAPRGETFHYVRSDGGSSPIRHKVRAPTYVNLPTCKATLPGSQLADAIIILASIDPCYCCTERVAVVSDRKKKYLTQEDLIKLSWEKTERLRRKYGR